MKDLLGHMGAWAPRAEQVAVAKFLEDGGAVAAFRAVMDARVKERLHALHRGFTAMREEGSRSIASAPKGESTFRSAST